MHMIYDMKHLMIDMQQDTTAEQSGSELDSFCQVIGLSLDALSYSLKLKLV